MGNPIFLVLIIGPSDMCYAVDHRMMKEDLQYKYKDLTSCSLIQSLMFINPSSIPSCDQFATLFYLAVLAYDTSVALP